MAASVCLCQCVTSQKPLKTIVRRVARFSHLGGLVTFVFDTNFYAQGNHSIIVTASDETGFVKKRAFRPMNRHISETIKDNMHILVVTMEDQQEV